MPPTSTTYTLDVIQPRFLMLCCISTKHGAPMSLAGMLKQTTLHRQDLLSTYMSYDESTEMDTVDVWLMFCGA